MKTNKGSPLPIDIHKDIYSFFNTDGILTLYYNPVRAKVFYPEKTYDLIEDRQSSGGAQEFLSLLEEEKLCHSEDLTKVIIPFYELGHLFENSKESKEFNEERPLGIWIEYRSNAVIEDKVDASGFNIELESASYDTYKESYERGRDHLLRGDCYQYNLTFAQELKIENFSLELFLSRWQNRELRGEYANLTSINEKIFFSNSPECLFELKLENESIELHSKPIKGTMPILNEDKDQAWESLVHSRKDESELYMITDLLRNDLNRIEKPEVQVVSLKERLEVPGLIHSYSHLKVNLTAKTNLLTLLKAIFPGGSITGAPKKRVMEIIDEIEISERGFYCGSSILKNKESFRASINIRSGELDKTTAEVLYWSGGGVTIQSECASEYQEFLDKTHSFVRFLS